MNDRSPPILIRSCCCNHHQHHQLSPGEKPAPFPLAHFSNRVSQRSEINICHLPASLRAKLNSRRADDLGSQAETLAAYSSRTASMDGDTDSFSNRYMHVLNCSNTHQGCSGTGCVARRDRTLGKNRKSESCFDLIGENRYGAHLDNDRLTPTARRPVSSVSSRDSWSAALPRTSSQRAPLYSRQTCSKNHDDNKGVTAYLTPLQRKERELKQIKKDISKLMDDVDERDSIILSLKYEMDSDTRSFRDESDRKITDLEQALKDSEREREEREEEVKSLTVQLEETESKLSKIKVEHEHEKEQFKDKYLDMYVKGQRAATFEREEELEMLTSKKKEKVTARELARKLSRTEGELAKWQTLRLEEAYTTPTKPDSNSEVTLNFLKDSFYHFITDPLNCLQHFRAMVEIFKYNDEQIKVIRKSIAESKELKKILKRD